MTDVTNGEITRNESIPAGQLLDEILDDIANSMIAGESVDIDAYIKKHPSHEKLIRQALPGLQAMLELGLVTEDGEKGAGSDILAKRGTLGDFRIIGELGRGGMGVVYEAEQLSLERIVAIKVLPFAGMLNANHLKRFQHEARAAATLHHPNIVPVYFVGHDRGVHYYAMQFIDGMSLADVAAQIQDRSGSGPNAALHRESTPDDTSNGQHDDQACMAADTDTGPVASLSTQHNRRRQEYFRSVTRLFLQATDALEYAHREGVIHRDIKPSNLLLDSTGKLWVTDFGLARIQKSEHLTATGEVVGTLRYMSAEQLDAHGMVDQRTDVYSLGLTLYELLVGRPAFTADHREQLVNQITSGVVTPPSKLDRAIPRDLETIVLKAIACEPAARYESAASLQADLQRFLDNKPISARRASRLESSRQWARRNPQVASLVGLVATLLMLLSVVSVVAAWRATRSADMLQQQVEARDQLLDERKRNADIMRRQVEARDQLLHERTLMLYAGDMKYVRSAVDQGDYDVAEHTLEKWEHESGEKDLRGIEWYYLWKKCHSAAPHNEFENELKVFGVAYSEDGTRLAVSTGWTRAIQVIDARNGKLIRTLKSRNKAKFVMFRPPGTNKLVEGDSGGHVKIWDFNTLEEVDPPLSLPEASEIYSIAISPDQRYVAVANGKKSVPGLKIPSNVKVWDRAEARWIPLANFTGIVHLGFVGNNDDYRLITGCYEDELRVWDCKTWEVLQPIRLSTGEFVTLLEISNDGSLIAAATARPTGDFFDSTIRIWSSETYQLVQRIDKHRDVVEGLSFSPPDDRLLAASSVDGAISLTDTSNGQTTLIANAHPDRARHLTFTPNGEYLCSEGGSVVRVWSVSDLLTRRSSDVIFRQHSGYVCSSAYLDEGSTVCSADPDGRMTVWDARTGQVDPTKTRHVIDNVANDSRIAVSPDKLLLAVRRSNFPPRSDIKTKLEMFSLPSLSRKYQVLLPTGQYHPTFSSDSRVLAIPSEHKLLLIEAETGKTLDTFGPLEGRVLRPAFSRDGRWMAFGTTNGITYIYDFQTLTLIKEMKTDKGFTMAVEFSPNGEYLMTGGADARIKCWDTTSFRQLPQIGQCTNVIIRLSFSRDGDRLLSCCGDGRLQIWRPTLGEELLTLRLKGSWPHVGEFAEDGSGILAATAYGAVVFHAADPKRLDPLMIERLRHLGCDW